MRHSPTVERLRARPRLTLSSYPADLTVDGIARFRVLGTGPSAADYRWDLDRSGRYAIDTGTASSLTHIYRSPGPRAVSVRVTIGTSTRLASTKVTVRDRRHSQVHQEIAAAPAPPVVRSAALRAHVAADPGVTIADFAFSPGTTTVHLGDTITWTNNGPSAHSATARDGSFDSGILARGQRASHTFTQAGGFA